MQPPDTDPMTVPSSRIANVAPSGRGLEPQVLVTVMSSHRLPAAIQRSQAFRTSRSTLSIDFSQHWKVG